MRNYSMRASKLFPSSSIARTQVNGACFRCQLAHTASLRPILTQSYHHNSTRRKQSTWAQAVSVASNVFSNATTRATGGGDSIDPLRMVAKEMKFLTGNIRQLLGSGHPSLDTVAKYYTQAEGKHVRPMIVLLMSRATALAPKSSRYNPNQEIADIDNPISPTTILSDVNPTAPTLNPLAHVPRTYSAAESDILPSQRRLAEITELIHTASLLHDDVIDHSVSRRGNPSANLEFGNKMAVLAGDFLLSRASVALARLRDAEVTELLATVIANLVEGEFMQLKNTALSFLQLAASFNSQNHRPSKKLLVMEHKLATAEKKLLVDLVKLVQKRGLEGENGGWKEFLNVYDKKLGSSLSDPARRSNDVLVAFLLTFKKKEDLQLIARVMQCGANRELIEKFKQETPDKETPEQRLVRLTITHDDYPGNYTFPSYAEDWYVTELGKKKSKVIKSTRMLSIDCEMVTCEDGSQALVRVGAVDRDLKVVLDKFVKPDKPVIDYKTDITGVTAEDLERATLSVADIQKKLRRFLSVGTILVGHGLHNDLQVLRIDHARVIDTSYVFEFVDAPKTQRPSLNNLCKSVLGQEVRMDGAAHNCVHDAAAAMKLVLAAVEKGAATLIQPTEEMMVAEKRRQEARQEAGKAQLFLHKIPHDVPSEELHGVLSGNFTLVVKPPKTGGYSTAVVDFSSPEEANEAFENVEGDVAKDKSGLPQKKAVLKLSSGLAVSLFVRKMVQDDSPCEISTSERARAEENNVSSKRQKTEDETEETKEATVNQREADKTKLFLHKIPHDVPSQELHGVLNGDFTLDVKPPKRKGGYYNAVVDFNSPEEANEAFENVEGDVVKDKTGLPQKMVVFKLSSGSGVSLYVRKMVHDDSPGEISTTKRARTEESNMSSKRQKTEDESEETKEANAKQREADKTKLLLHKIPLNVPSQELKVVITGQFTLEVMPPKRKGRYYNAVVTFNSPEEANKAFEKVKGEAVKEKGGLAQKMVAFKLSSGSGACLYVRKMVQDESEETKEANANHCEDDHLKEMEELKEKLKAMEFAISCEGHSKEIEELKQKLNAKEHQIQAQDKIIANLKMKLEKKQSKSRS